MLARQIAQAIESGASPFWTWFIENPRPNARGQFRRVKLSLRLRSQESAETCQRLGVPCFIETPSRNRRSVRVEGILIEAKSSWNCGRIVISTAAAAENADWFGKRLFDAFAEDLRSPAYEAPAPNASPQQRRIPPAPFDSPPFPSADWQIGGTPIIGDPGNIAPWPLMEAIYAGPNGDAWKKSRIQIYGWENFSWNLSTSHKHFARAEREFSTDLRSAAEPNRTKSVRSLHRARA